jgi:hypothetical protein
VVVSGASFRMTIAGVIGPAAMCSRAGRALEVVNGAVTALTRLPLPVNHPR